MATWQQWVVIPIVLAAALLAAHYVFFGRRGC